MMIKEAFREDKHFILAKIKTRSISSSANNLDNLNTDDPQIGFAQIRE